jgi:hypothetical protein
VRRLPQAVESKKWKSLAQLARRQPMYSKTEESQVIKAEVLVVGIDVAKRSHVATIRHFN